MSLARSIKPEMFTYDDDEFNPEPKLDEDGEPGSGGDLVVDGDITLPPIVRPAGIWTTVNPTEQNPRMAF
jgi:hypothetical protein